MALSVEARSTLRLVSQPILLVAGLAAAGVLLRLLPLRHFATTAGSYGLPAFVVLGGAACALGVPRQAVAFAAGFAHGPLLGVALALAAQMLGCAANLVWARLGAQRFVAARLRGRVGTRLARLHGVLTARPFTATLTLRLLPIGNNLALNVLAGALGVAPGSFLAASALGYLPQTFVFVLLGTGIDLGQRTILAVSALTFAASAILGWHLLRRSRDLA
jgi:uncharacterized membrane protein YdjX (TVP38/TMEM64 family)